MKGFQRVRLRRLFIASLKTKEVFSMMYAVIETGGKQYQVKEGDEIFIEKLEQSFGEIVFDKVVMVGGGDSAKIGDPYVGNAKVKGTVVKNGKGKKITVFSYKPKKSVKRKLGHRQPYSKVKIEEITA
jgi:large subunit ribosomal protein L21